MNNITFSSGFINWVYSSTLNQPIILHYIYVEDY